MRELAGLEEPKMREANERRGDDHGVNLTQLRALAKRLKTQHELAVQLWATGDTAARLLATLVCKPKSFAATELDVMIRGIRSPKLLDWFVVNVVKPSRHAEQLRVAWKDGDEVMGRAGWSLTTARVVKRAEGLDLEALLDQIEKEMKQAPAHKQWAMNHCLAEIGIHHPQHRKRAIAIGERLAVLIDYPASPGCTPPYAPVWIAEMVRRHEETRGRAQRPKKGALLMSLFMALTVLTALAQEPVRITPGATGTKPAYRETKTGETRVEGLLQRVECPRGKPVMFTLRANDKPERFEAARLADVEFVAHTPDFKGPFTCGGRGAGDRVFLTWKASGRTRTVVAVEFLPK
jgi:3-methyladenine DNA glycosylase AlkD